MVGVILSLALFFAQHNGLKSIGYVACLGLTTTLVVSFTVLAAVLPGISSVILAVAVVGVFCLAVLFWSR